MSASERGFTLIEILISLVVFAIIALGAIAALGVTTASGYLEAFPTSFGTVRTARDYTAAATYLQTIEEFAANKGFTAAGADNTYTVNGPAAGTACTGSLAGVPWTGAPCPENEPYQLNWETLTIKIEEWNWDQTNKKYCLVDSTGCAAIAGTESVKLVEATLTWKFNEQPRSMTVKRFLAECESNWPASFCVP